MKNPMNTPAESLPIIHNLPEGLTLADLCLEGVKVGDEIVSIFRAENGGGFSVTPHVFHVHAHEGWRVILRNEKGKTHGAWQTKNGGGCPWAMHGQHIMRYYYSANPAHVAQARRDARAIKAAEETRKAAFEAQMVIARPIGEALGDGWQSGSNGEDDFQSSTAAQTLAERLTPEQMRTLAGWLGMKMG